MSPIWKVRPALDWGGNVIAMKNPKELSFRAQNEPGEGGRTIKGV